jgi:hypothetical protein
MRNDQKAASDTAYLQAIDAKLESITHDIALVGNSHKMLIEHIAMLEKLIEQQSTPGMGQAAAGVQVPLILKELIDAGQLRYENGEYKPTGTMPELITWCMQNGFDDIKAGFVHKTIKNVCTLKTIKAYIRDAKEKSQITKKTKKTKI